MLYGISASDELFCLDPEESGIAWSTSIGQAEAAGAAPRGQAPDARRGAPRRGQPGGGPGGRGGRGGGGNLRPGYGSTLDVGPALMALSPHAELIVFEPSANEFKQLARYKVADSPTYAYPVVAGKRIYVKDQDSITLWTID